MGPPASRRLAATGFHPLRAPSESSSSYSVPIGVPSSSSYSSSALFWRLLHVVCCILSAVLGFRCSRFIFLLLLAASTDDLNLGQQSHLQSADSVALGSPLPLLPPPPPPPSTSAPPPPSSSHVVVGRHGILVRPSSHPDPAEVARAHRILARVQQEQRLRYSGVRNPRPLLVVTPTYARTFQALHLAGLLHSLKLIPYPLTWIVVDASPSSGTDFNDTAAFLARSGLHVVHLPFPEPMPLHWSNRHSFEVRMRLYALRLIREQRLVGIVVFADDSNVHSMELFDEIQKVKWMGAVSVGILMDSPVGLGSMSEDTSMNSRLPVQGPTCNSSGELIGWHAHNLLLHANGSTMFSEDAGIDHPRKMEWAGFVMDSRLLWREVEDKPNWVRDFDYGSMKKEEIDSPLDLLKDSTFVEPLGSCGKKVLLWWLRLEARYDSNFPSGWVIDPPLDITVSAKRLPLPKSQFLSRRLLAYQEYLNHSSIMGGGLWYTSNSKSKHEEEHIDTQIPEVPKVEESRWY